MPSFALFVLAFSPLLCAQADDWSRAEANGRQSQQAIQFCHRYAHGWLGHADTKSGLLPRTLKGDALWNAKDCAADNYPFLALTARMTGDFYLERTAAFILEQETKLTCRLDRLPDDFLFATQKFRTEQYKLPDLIFGAAEYAKDGLMPMTEWLGPGPWLDRMQGLVQDVFKHAPLNSPVGKWPSDNVEVIGDLLQVTSRLYWATGDEDYRTWAFRMADFYLLHHDLLAGDNLRLRDHGCEIIGGLSEACLIASREDPQRWEKYRPKMTAILDRVLEVGVNPDGMMYNAVNPRTGTTIDGNLSDGWGYVYNAFLTIAAITGDNRYREPVTRALSNLNKYRGYTWEGSQTNVGADGYADSIESALNLLARLPDAGAFEWVDSEIEFIFKKQRPDGIIEGWYGDGNSARTMMMYALWKTQGATLAPWRDDLKLGAVRQSDGAVLLSIAADFEWDGQLRFDRPRHRTHMHMPLDYPRINQFPEWFTAAPQQKYQIKLGDEPARTVGGGELYAYPLHLKPGGSIRLTVRPHADPAEPRLRTMRYSPRSADQARAWQRELRQKLRELLKLQDVSSEPLAPQVLKTEELPGHLLQEVELQATRKRRIKALVAIPRGVQPPYPAVVCIHGHGGNRQIVYDQTSVYRGFATRLAQTGYVTIATDVGRHEVYEPGRTLMGERLSDLMRCVDYLATMKEVGARRVGCAGLSLGGEMAMWLAAMDERIAATVSSGFLTTMDQMEQNHCMCWKLPGLRELVDFSDIYSLIAPRPLQCQNGLAEPPEAFVVPLAREAMREIDPIYRDLGAAGVAKLGIHREGHVIDLPSLLAFFSRHLKPT